VNTVRNILSISDSKLVNANRTIEQVFYHLVEEVGEVATAINRPEKVTELPQSEIADVIVAAIDLLYLVQKQQDPSINNDSIVNELNRVVDLKLLKWVDGSKKYIIIRETKIQKWWSKLWNN
jgi:NTP pyrophosphatase (non-canonical NTP hydrolase)